jgi:hypothetical protein
MSSPKIQIANLALLKMGESTITSFDDGTKASNTIAAAFDHSVRYVLEQRNWHRAIKTVQIAANTDGPVVEYTSSHRLPSDFVRVVSVRNPAKLVDTDYVIHGDNIHTNNTSIYLVYIRDITQSNSFPAYLADLIASYLAWNISPFLSADSDNTGMMQRKYQASLAAAKTLDSQAVAQSSYLDTSSTFLDSRYN